MKTEVTEIKKGFDARC
jgi:chromosome segregation ATPase